MKRMKEKRHNDADGLNVQNTGEQEKNIGSKKTSKQMKLSVAMVIVSLIILSISTYAWFLITNTPKVKNIALTADTLGDLKIADSITESGAEKAGTYGDELDLQGVNMNNLYLSPVTTKDGITFFKPIYTEGEVTSVEEVTDDTGLHKKYVYEKDFYLKAGEAGSTVTDTTAKNYDIYFVGYSTKENSGTYVADKDGATVTAANAIRISFTFSGGSLSTPVTVIYEPNCDVDNGGITESQAATKNSSSDASTTVVANMANFVMNSDDAAEYGTLGEKYGTDTAKTKGYSTIKQYKADHSFVPNSGIKTRSTSLVTIKEGEDIHVTMRIWLEGTDKDCMNTIAADQIVGQIQFISEENLDQFKEEETTTATESTSAAETTTTAGN